MTDDEAIKMARTWLYSPIPLGNTGRGCACSDCRRTRHLADLLLSVAGNGGLSLTLPQLTDACKNIGYDLTCPTCAAIFFTGFAMPGDSHTCACSKKEAMLVTVGPPLEATPLCATGTLFADTLIGKCQRGEGDR